MGASISCLGSSDVLLETSAQKLSTGGDAVSNLPPKELCNGNNLQGEVGGNSSLRRMAADIHNPSPESDGSPLTSAADTGRIPDPRDTAPQGFHQGTALGAVLSTGAVEPPSDERQGGNLGRRATVPAGPGAGATSVSSAAPGADTALNDRKADKMDTCVGAESSAVKVESKARQGMQSTGAAPSKRYRSSLDLNPEMGLEPSCEPVTIEEATQVSAQHLNKPPDAELDPLMKLAQAVFQTEWACVTLVTSDRHMYISNATGSKAGYLGRKVPWSKTGCGFTLISNHHEVLVVPDMHCDARFGTRMVDRFFAAAPLVASSGHRIGTICMGCKTPRHITAEEVNILINMAEMVVRRVEQSWALANRQKQLLQQQLARGLLPLILPGRGSAAYTTPVMFVDTSPDPWQMRYCNPAAAKLAGLDGKAQLCVPLPQVLARSDGASIPYKVYRAKAAAGMRFQVRNIVFQAVEGNTAAAGDCRSSWTLHLRPAATDVVDEQAASVGVPAFCPPSVGSLASQFYIASFVEVPARDSAALSLAHTDSSSPASAFGQVPKAEPSDRSAKKAGVRGRNSRDKGTLRRLGRLAAGPPAVPDCFPGLKLGQLLGKGSYGSVFRGCYKDQPVAVKIVPNERVKFDANGVPMEALLLERSAHPGLVRIIAHAVLAKAARPSSKDCPQQPSAYRGVGGKALSTAEPNGAAPYSDSKACGQGPGRTVLGADALTGSLEGISSPVIGLNQQCTAQGMEMGSGSEQGYSSGSSAGAESSMQRFICGFDSAIDSELDALYPDLFKGFQAPKGFEDGSTWLIMDFCDSGTLQDGASRGMFLHKPPRSSLGPALRAVLATALEISSAVAHLHRCGIVHGDLSGGNIMLCSNPAQPHGFSARVADFGLSRIMDVQSRMLTQMYGTVTHMPPELISEGITSKAVDVYAMGVLMWEMYHGRSAWRGFTQVQIIEAVARDRKQLQFYRNPSLPRNSVVDDFYTFVESCTTYDRAERPTAAEAEQKLRSMHARCCKALEEPTCPVLPMGVVPPRDAALAGLLDVEASALSPTKDTAAA